MPVEWWISVSMRVAHVLAGGAWFGAMFYSLTALHPRAQRFFSRDEEFEAFITTLADGARWKVLGAFALIAATGVAMLIFSRHRGRPARQSVPQSTWIPVSPWYFGTWTTTNPPRLARRRHAGPARQYAPGH